MRPPMLSKSVRSLVVNSTEGVYPAQMTTGIGGYFWNSSGNDLCSEQSVNSEPFADRTTVACSQSPQSPGFELIILEQLPVSWRYEALQYQLHTQKTSAPQIRFYVTGGRTRWG